MTERPARVVGFTNDTASGLLMRRLPMVVGIGTQVKVYAMVLTND